jgi:hypothetical protein
MGRTLHLLDVEYLGCGPAVTAGDLDLVMRRYRPLSGWQLGDHIVGAASHWVYKRIAFDAPHDIRLLPAGGGPDAADHRLLDEAGGIDLTRYERIAVGSGDHLFAALVCRCHALGLQTCVVGYRHNIAPPLAVAADVVIDLTGPEPALLLS